MKLFSFQPLHANSITQAHACFDKLQLDNNQPVLVGGKKYVILKADQLAEHDVNLCFSGPVVATSCRSLLVYTKVNDTCRGMLYRLREVSLNEEEQVIEIKFLLSAIN